MRIHSTRFIHLVFVLNLATAWSLLTGGAGAQNDPHDVYLAGFLEVKEAENLVKAKDYQNAYRKYVAAQKIYTTLAQRFPGFEASLVDFRRRKINESIAEIESIPGFDGKVLSYGTRSGRNNNPVGRPQPTRPGTGASTGTGTNNRSGTVASQLLRQRDEQIAILERAQAENARQLAAKDSELRKVRAGRDIAERKAGSLSKQIAQMQDELTKAHNAGSSEAAGMKDEIARLQKELMLAEKSAKKSADLAENLKQELDKASNFELSSRDERKELEAERERLNKILSASENDQIKLLVSENKRLQSDLKAAREEAGKLRKENAGNKELIAKLRSKITTVEAELAKLQKENADYRDQVASLTEQLRQTDAQLDQMAKTKGGANPVLVKENKVLRSIISKQLKSQARRKQAKQRVIAELAKLEIGSKEVLDMIDRMGDSAPLTQEEIQTFARSAGIDPTTFAKGKDGKPIEYPEIVDNEGEKSKIGLNEDLTQFAKAAAFDFIQGNFNRSEASYERILKLVPDNVHSLRNLGIVKIRLRKWEEAKQTLEKALAYNPSDHYSHYILGVLHYRLKQPAEAIAAMEESLALEPKNPRAHFYIAVICMQHDPNRRNRRNPQRAIAELKKTVQLDPQFGDAHFNLAILYVESPQPQLLLARQHYDLAQRNGSQPTAEMDRRLGS